MHKGFRIALALLAAQLSLGATCQEKGRRFDYASLKDRCRGNFRLESGDVIRVHVWNEPNHSRDQVLVRPDGKISLPLVGDIHAAGLTVEDLARVTRRKVESFVPNPRVDVSLVRAQSYQVYVMGEVQRSGSFISQSPINVVQALSLAGGLTPFAKAEGIFIIWNGPDGEKRIPFNYDQVLRGKHPEQNITLCRGDTVIVP